jgi:predicted nucleic acid-binding protein
MWAMRQQGLTEVLTNDHHFEQEGFRALFRSDSGIVRAKKLGP